MSARGGIIKSVRSWIYELSSYIGFFVYIPLISRLPKRLSDFAVGIKAGFRFRLGSYRGYVDRANLKHIAIRNMMSALNINEKVATRKIKKFMLLEVFAERDGYIADELTESDMECRYHISGIENLEKALKIGKGVIFSTVHAGNIGQIGLLLSLKGLDMYSLCDGGLLRKQNGRAIELFAKLRLEKVRGNTGLLYSGIQSKECLSVLKNNGVILWMADVPPTHPKRSQTIQLFGKSIVVNSSFWDLAKKRGVPIIPNITVFDSRLGKYHLIIGHPVDTHNGSIQDMCNFFQQHLDASPESWAAWGIFDLFPSA